MAGQHRAILKAFILCDEIRRQANKTQMDLLGAGLGRSGRNQISRFLAGRLFGLTFS
jgi:hypothetical protein